MDMREFPGKTYRFYTETPLFEFGHGMLLTLATHPSFDYLPRLGQMQASPTPALTMSWTTMLPTLMPLATLRLQRRSLLNSSVWFNAPLRMACPS
jgi:hypothetical protein